MEKIIRDLVHGYIQIDDIEMRFIDTANFQRLKSIRQLTAQHAYPSANHTRFEHSLGVLHLAQKAFYNLRPVLTESYEISGETFERMMLHLRLGALLHDIGHAPFSHLGEKYFRRREIIYNITYIIKTKGLKIDSKLFDNNGSSHELMSCYIILLKYSEMMFNIRVDMDLELICRIIIGAKYLAQDKWLENIVIELVNSDTIDADKLDYLIRDAMMTGVSVPNIDTSRLFRNININRKLNRLTYNDKAIPVIQNIIDARDSMYLWVYNHHTAVYTDFVSEFYIKHMISNFEKGSANLDQLDPFAFFSCKAIADLLVTDSDLEYKFRFPLSIKEEQRSKYTKKILPQIIDRRFLKPLWKSIYEYKEFMALKIPDIGMRKDFEQKMCSESYVYRRFVVEKLIKDCDLNYGEIFIVPRSNKFYSLNPDKSSFRVYLGDCDKDLRELLPQKDFKEMYSNVNYYVFAAAEKLESVRNRFSDLVETPLPDKSQIPKGHTELDWFKEDF